ncbi:hypothetical protein SteCoe_7475 [Stentor coeruleus]|uniref:Protein kinase domain-containing protein n=1 Tax=Stentor coeruleus TaxID=5963 RepID=A0A1R2CMJ4_9CILI|nr:hypothetical protein SteCoe_7475 [Stentor coeruleus]
MEHHVKEFELPKGSVKMDKCMKIFHGENELLIADFLGEKVLLKKPSDRMYHDVNLEIFIFYFKTHRNLANCLGYIQIKSERYLVFDYQTMSLKNFKNICQDSASKEKIRRNLMNVFEFLYLQGIYIERLSLEDIVIDDTNDIKIYNLGGTTYNTAYNQEEKILHDEVLNHLLENFN